MLTTCYRLTVFSFSLLFPFRISYLLAPLHIILLSLPTHNLLSSSTLLYLSQANSLSLFIYSWFVKTVAACTHCTYTHHHSPVLDRRYSPAGSWARPASWAELLDTCWGFRSAEEDAPRTWLSFFFCYSNNRWLPRTRSPSRHI